MNMVEFSNQIPSEQLIMIFKNFFEEHVATYDLLKGIQFIKINNILNLIDYNVQTFITTTDIDKINDIVLYTRKIH